MFMFDNIWIWIAATTLAYFVKGLCGFGNTLVFSSIVGFNVDNINITPIDLMLTYPPNIILTVRNRKSLKASIFVPLTVLVLLGSVPGALILKNVDARYVKLVFGVVIILIGLEMFLREFSKKKLKESKILLTVIGILSGVLCGLFGIGALLAAYVSRVADSDGSFKANISVVFAAENTFRIIVYIVMGIITRVAFQRALIMMPFMLCGLSIGIQSARTMSEKVVKRLVVGLLIVSGVVMIVNSL